MTAMRPETDPEVQEQSNSILDWKDLYTRSKAVARGANQVFRPIRHEDHKWLVEETTGVKYKFDDNDQLKIQIEIVRDKNNDAATINEAFDEVIDLM